MSNEVSNEITGAAWDAAEGLDMAQPLRETEGAINSSMGAMAWYAVRRETKEATWEATYETKDATCIALKYATNGFLPHE